MKKMGTKSIESSSTTNERSLDDCKIKIKDMSLLNNMIGTSMLWV